MTKPHDCPIAELRAAFDRLLMARDRVDLSVLVDRCSSGIHIELLGPAGSLMVSHLRHALGPAVPVDAADADATALVCLTMLDHARGGPGPGALSEAARATAAARALARLEEIASRPEPPAPI